jgi:NitT/TauT family transport system permease protein
MKELELLFTPFAEIDKRVVAIMVASQLSLLLLIWYFGSYQHLPTPGKVIAAFGFMQEHFDLGSEYITSLSICIKAILLSAVVSATFAYLSLIPFPKYIVYFLTKGRYLTLTGLQFFFQLSFSNDSLKIALLTFGVSVFFTTSFIAIIKEIPPTKIYHARTTGLGPWRTLWEVVIYGTLDKLFEVLKQNFAMAWMMITMVEGLVLSGGGIGMMLINNSKTLSLDIIMALQLLVLVTGIVMDFLISRFTLLICPYSKYGF